MNDAVGLAFQERYQTKWDAPAGFSNAGTGYDEVYMLAHAWGITGDTRNFDANIAELKRNIYRGVSGGYWFGSRGGELLPLLPERDARSVAREPAPVLPDPARRQRGPRRTQIIDPAPYIQTEYVQPPWLSF